MAAVEGVEPSNTGVKVQCLTAWLNRNMAVSVGFEPTDGRIHRLFSKQMY